MRLEQVVFSKNRRVPKVQKFPRQNKGKLKSAFLNHSTGIYVQWLLIFSIISLIFPNVFNRNRKNCSLYNRPHGNCGFSYVEWYLSGLSPKFIRESSEWFWYPNGFLAAHFQFFLLIVIALILLSGLRDRPRRKRRSWWRNFDRYHQYQTLSW